MVTITMKKDGKSQQRRVYVPNDKMTVNEFVDESHPSKVDPEGIQCSTIDSIILNGNEPIVPALLGQRSRWQDGSYGVIFVLNKW